MGALVLGFIIAVSSFLASVQERRGASSPGSTSPAGRPGRPRPS